MQFKEIFIVHLRSQTLHFKTWIVQTDSPEWEIKGIPQEFLRFHVGRTTRRERAKNPPKFNKLFCTYVRPELELSTILPKPKVAHSIYSCANFSNYKNKFEWHYEWVHEISTNRSRPLRFLKQSIRKFCLIFGALKSTHNSISLRLRLQDQLDETSVCEEIPQTHPFA